MFYPNQSTLKTKFYDQNLGYKRLYAGGKVEINPLLTKKLFQIVSAAIELSYIEDVTTELDQIIIQKGYFERSKGWIEKINQSFDYKYEELLKRLYQQSLFISDLKTGLSHGNYCVDHLFFDSDLDKVILIDFGNVSNLRPLYYDLYYLIQSFYTQLESSELAYKVYLEIKNIMTNSEFEIFEKGLYTILSQRAIGAIFDATVDNRLNFKIAIEFAERVLERSLFEK